MTAIILLAAGSYPWLMMMDLLLTPASRKLPVTMMGLKMD